MKAQGEALGTRRQYCLPALKGRHLSRITDEMSPFHGYDGRIAYLPRALPWAIIFQPFGLYEIRPLSNHRGTVPRIIPISMQDFRREAGITK